MRSTKWLIPLILLATACATGSPTWDLAPHDGVEATVEALHWIQTDEVTYDSRARFYDVYAGDAHVAIIEGAERPDGSVQAWTEPASRSAPLSRGDRISLVEREIQTPPPDRFVAGVGSIPPLEGPSPEPGRKRRILLVRLSLATP